MIEFLKIARDKWKYLFNTALDISIPEYKTKR